jgi:hypothetical protein
VDRRKTVPSSKKSSNMPLGSTIALVYVILVLVIVIIEITLFVSLPEDGMDDLEPYICKITHPELNATPIQPKPHPGFNPPSP